LRELPLNELRRRLDTVPGASAIAVQSLSQLRDNYTVDGRIDGSDLIPNQSFRLRRSPHPCGYPTTLPLATWIRPALSAITTLQPAPAPGKHTSEVLREAGFSDEAISRLLDSGTVQNAWKLLDRYLPY
jgi:hypothetical protein